MWVALGPKSGLCRLLLLLDSVKPVFGQLGDVLDLNQVFVGFLVLLDSVKSILGKFILR